MLNVSGVAVRHMERLADRFLVCTDLNFQGWITRSEASADFNPTFRGVK